MDEDELLYREINPEDPWYMGDEPGGEYEDEEVEYDDDEEDASRWNSFLLFWKPKSKSCKFSLEDYAQTRQQFGKRFTLHKWPIDWPDNAVVGARYFMVRVDGEATGIVWHGTFASDPYVDKGRNGRGKQWCVDINVEDAVKPDGESLVTIEEMRELNTETKWERLKGGQMIDSEVTDRFDDLIARKKQKESHLYKGYSSREAYEKYQRKQLQNDVGYCLFYVVLTILAIVALMSIF